MRGRLRGQFCYRRAPAIAAVAERLTADLRAGATQESVRRRGPAPVAEVRADSCRIPPTEVREYAVPLLPYRQSRRQPVLRPVRGISRSPLPAVRLRTARRCEVLRRVRP